MADQNDYLGTLLHPESVVIAAKIPSMMPVPSTCFKLRQSFNVTCNALGNAVLMVNPFFLGKTPNPQQLTFLELSSVYLNNDPSLTLGSPSNFFKAINVGQSITPVYSQYRLVSGSLIGNYYGKFNEMSGYIGGAIVYDKNVVKNTETIVSPDLQIYGNRNLISDSHYHNKESVIEGIRLIYFPLDNSFEEYISLDESRNGFSWAVYIGNAPALAVFNFDLSLNFECLPTSDFLNYIPVSPPARNVSKKEESVQIAAKEPVSSAVAAKIPVKKSGNGFGNMIQGLISKVGDNLPMIGEIAGKILSAIL